jgi:hypothetical protein
MEIPRLVESGARAYLEFGLRKAREIRVNAYFYIFNAFVACVFLVVVFAFLWACYRPRLSAEERTHKLMRDQALILAKIRGYQEFSATQTQ